MRDLMVFGTDNGVGTPLFKREAGSWTCLCCDNPITTEKLIQILAGESSKEPDLNKSVDKKLG
jgi:hypothetical protein